MFSVSPEIYSVLSVASRWLFAFFALMLLFFAFAWHRSERKERKERFKNLPGAGNIGELVVLSGSDELRQDTWFPVPREGVLGSLRSCDLVVPCPGVNSQHLDFSWQDGTGLLIRPRVGCEVFIDGVPVSRRGTWADAPLTHGSVLQVGSAVLRLQLFSALSHTNRSFTPYTPVSAPNAGAWTPPPAQVPPAAAGNWQAAPAFEQPVPDQSAVLPPVSGPYQPAPEAYQPTPETYQSAAVTPDQPPQTAPAPRPRRADRWKEDWSE